MNLGDDIFADTGREASEALILPRDVQTASELGARGTAKADHAHRGVAAIEAGGEVLRGEVEFVEGDGIDISAVENDREVTIAVDGWDDIPQLDEDEHVTGEWWFDGGLRADIIGSSSDSPADAIILNSDVDVSGILYAHTIGTSMASPEGHVQVLGDFHVDGTIVTDVIMASGESPEGTLEIGSDVTVLDDLGVYGNLAVDQIVPQTTSPTPGVRVDSDLIVSEDLDVAGDALMEGELEVQGDLKVTTIMGSGESPTGTIEVASDAQFISDVDVAGGIDVDGDSVLAGDLAVSGETQTGSLDVTGDATLTTVTATGEATLSGGIITPSIMGSGESPTGTLELASDVTVLDDLTATSLHVSEIINTQALGPVMEVTGTTHISALLNACGAVQEADQTTTDNNYVLSSYLQLNLQMGYYYIMNAYIHWASAANQFNYIHFGYDSGESTPPRIIGLGRHFYPSNNVGVDENLDGDANPFVLVPTGAVYGSAILTWVIKVDQGSPPAGTHPFYLSFARQAGGTNMTLRKGSAIWAIQGQAI